MEGGGRPGHTLHPISTELRAPRLVFNGRAGREMIGPHSDDPPNHVFITAMSEHQYPRGTLPLTPLSPKHFVFFFWGGGRTTHPPPQAATVSLPQTHGRSGPYWKPKAQGCESPPSHVNNNNDNTTHCFPSGGLECTLLILLQHAHKSVQF